MRIHILRKISSMTQSTPSGAATASCPPATRRQVSHYTYTTQRKPHTHTHTHTHSRKSKVTPTKRSCCWPHVSAPFFRLGTKCLFALWFFFFNVGIEPVGMAKDSHGGSDDPHDGMPGDTAACQATTGNTQGHDAHSKCTSDTK